MTFFNITTWLVLSVMFGALMGWRIPSLMALKENGVPTDAEVISITANLRNTYHYSYTVDKKTYEGVTQIIDVAPRLGAKVAITYLPESPNVSYPGDVQGQIDNDWISAVLAAVILPSFVLLSNLVRLKWRNKHGD